MEFWCVDDKCHTRGACQKKVSSYYNKFISEKGGKKLRAVSCLRHVSTTCVSYLEKQQQLP